MLREEERQGETRGLQTHGVELHGIRCAAVVGPFPILEHAQLGLVGIDDLDAEVFGAAPSARHRPIAFAHCRHDAPMRPPTEQRHA